MEQYSELLDEFLALFRQSLLLPMQTERQRVGEYFAARFRGDAPRDPELMHEMFRLRRQLAESESELNARMDEIRSQLPLDDDQFLEWALAQFEGARE